MTNINISEAANITIGAVGSFCMLLAYAWLNFRKNLGAYAIDEDSLLYCTLNLVGGALASASAVLTMQPGSYPLAVLEGAWAVIGFIGVVRFLRGRCSAQALHRREEAALGLQCDPHDTHALDHRTAVGPSGGAQLDI